MKNNIYFIIDDSFLFRQEQKEKILKEWQTNAQELIYTEVFDLTTANKRSLFSKRSFFVVDLTQKENLANFKEFTKELLKKTNKHKLESKWYGDGVIFLVEKTLGSWLEKFSEEVKGHYITKENIKDLKKKFAKDNKIGTELAESLLFLAGDDSDLLFLYEKAIKEYYQENQSEPILEEILSISTTRTGDVAPWEFISSIFENDTQKNIALYKRIRKNIPIFVIITLIKQKLELLLQYRTLVLSKKTKNQIYGELGKKSFVFKDIENLRTSLKNIQNVIKETLKLEDNFKGGLPVAQRLEEELVVSYLMSLNYYLFY